MHLIAYICIKCKCTCAFMPECAYTLVHRCAHCVFMRAKRAAADLRALRRALFSEVRESSRAIPSELPALRALRAILVGLKIHL